MRHFSAATLASLVTIAVVLGLLVGFGLAASAGGHSLAAAKPSAAPTVGGSAKATFAKPLAPHPAAVPPSVTVTILTNFNGKLYVAAPFQLNFTIAVTGTNINSTTTTVYVEYQDALNHRKVTNWFGLAVGVGQTSYTTWVNSVNVSAGLPVATGSDYLITVGANATNLTSLTTDPANATGSGKAGTSANLIFSPLHGEFVAPIANHFIGPGNVTIVVSYGGDFILNANVTVFKVSSTGSTIVFASPTFQPGQGNRTVAAIAPWVVNTPGSYRADLVVNASYTTSTFSQWINVSNVGGIVYFNQSSWNNATLIPGVSPAVGGTILLVVGLVVGMGVALALGRSMWGGGMKAAPAQPWAAAKPGTFECSVCHQSFPTEDALKEHQKSAHGMT